MTWKVGDTVYWGDRDGVYKGVVVRIHMYQRAPHEAEVGGVDAIIEWNAFHCPKIVRSTKAVATLGEALADAARALETWDYHLRGMVAECARRAEVLAAYGEDT